MVNLHCFPTKFWQIYAKKKTNHVLILGKALLPCMQDRSTTDQQTADNLSLLVINGGDSVQIHLTIFPGDSNYETKYIHVTDQTKEQIRREFLKKAALHSQRHVVLTSGDRTFHYVTGDITLTSKMYRPMWNWLYYGGLSCWCFWRQKKIT